MPPSLSLTIARPRPTRYRAAPTDPMPDQVEPMLAVLSDLPPDPQHYTFEYKWDGVRAVAFVDRGRVRMHSRNRLDITPRYPELHALAAALGGRSAVLDGEVVALDDVGRPSFAKLQSRMHVTDPHAVRRLMRTTPVWYVVFDLLHLDGRDVTSEPYTRRRELLKELTIAGPYWQVTPAHVGQGASMLAAARQNGLEGLVAKRLDSVYEPGRRSPAWRKIKIVQRQEFVVGGWVPERSDRAGRVGAMLIGYHDCDGRLRYAGKIGSGLTAGDHAALRARLLPLARPINPFADAVPVRDAVYVAPRVVIEVEYRRWPADGMVQQGAFKGVRADKPAKEVVREDGQM